MFYLDAIVCYKDLLESMERIRREQKERKTISERIKEQKGALSVGKEFNAGLIQIGKTVFDIINNNVTNTRRVTKEKSDEALIYTHPR